MKNLLGRIMLNTTPEEQRIKDIRDSLTKLSSATAENLVYVIKPFLDLLADPKNHTILDHLYLYPYFAALIKEHSAILNGLTFINAELDFQVGTTPLMQLIGIYKLALFTCNNRQQERSLEDCLNDYSFSAQHGNLQAATALIQYYFKELPHMSEDNFESFVRMINKSVFSNPTALQASGFFLSAQLYYQISQRYLQKEKDNPNNSFKYFEKSVLHYITARHLLRAGHGQEPMPLVVTEKIYPSIEDEEGFMLYITNKAMFFKEESSVLLDCNFVARQASLKAENCALEYSTHIARATKPLNGEELDKIIQKILNELKPISLISYPGAYFSPASADVRPGPSNAASIPGLKQ